ncbi:MAG: amidohydrolase family protein [Candidatus Thermoplasmatota archaeon]|nr:amidohydrolase family protein [Candidatus Thermoplasmatota archaeon]
MQYVQGEILTRSGFLTGYLEFEHGNGTGDIRKGTPPKKPVAKGLILPTCVNAHTHLGDSFIRFLSLQLPRTVKDLVAPPAGLKHRLLKEASEQEILTGIQRSLEEMSTAGTASFCDFREGGLLGVYQLRKAMQSCRLKSVILSRPSQMTYDKEQLDRLLENSDGIGLSSISDWEAAEIEKLASHVRRKNKLFALHASEVDREDIDRVLDLRPRFLVHMIAATKADLERVTDAQIPIVVCPRSYMFFRLKHNLPLMKKTGVTLLLGTDNAMINTPDVLEEVKVLQNTGAFSLEELLTTVTYTPRKALNLDDGIQARDLSEEFIVLERDSLKLLYVSK